MPIDSLSADGINTTERTGKKPLPAPEQNESTARAEIEGRVLAAAKDTMRFIQKNEAAGVSFSQEEAALHEAWNGFVVVGRGDDGTVEQPPLTPTPESRETGDSNPFIIRGHHLQLFQDLLTASDAAEKAHAVRKYIEDDRRKGLDNPSSPDSADKVAYANDVIGAPEQSQAFQEYLERVFQEFVSLPDDAPVAVTEGIKDRLCFGCALGAHCTKKFVNGNPDHSRLKEDQDAIDQVLKSIGSISEENGTAVEITRETLTFTDSPEPESVRRVSMSAGVLKKALAQGKEVPHAEETQPATSGNIPATENSTVNGDTNEAFKETGGMPPDVFAGFKFAGENHFAIAKHLTKDIPGASVTTERDPENQGGAIRVVNWFVDQQYQDFFRRRQEEFLRSGRILPFSEAKAQQAGVSGKEALSPKVVSLEELRTEIDLRYLPTLQEILAAEKIDEAGLFQRIKEKAEATVGKAARLDNTNEEFRFLYDCYHALAELPEVPEVLIPVQNGLSSFQNFLDTFLEGGTSIRNDYNYYSKIDKVYQEANQDALIRFNMEGSRNAKPTVARSREDAGKKEWLVLPNRVGDGGYDIAITQAVYQEALARRPEWKLRPGLDHATTSAALPGIARHGALLSRTELAKRGEVAVSGERDDNEPRVFVARGVNHGAQYSTVSWFNEFPIDFEFDPAAEDLREANAPNYGISLGHEVPLRYIKRLYGPEINIPAISEWRDQHVPHADVVSYEAYYAKDWIK